LKILLLPDVKNWAWDRNADALIKYLPQYDFDKFYFKGKLPSNWEEYDHIHSMGWLDAKFVSDKVTAGVCSHNFELRNQNGEGYFDRFKYLTANSRILYDIVSKYTDRVLYAPNGVHEDIFTPRIKTPKKKFIVGWVGQKTTGGLNLYNNSSIDIKGFSLVLEPLMQRLSNNKNIEFKILSNNYKNCVSHDKMPDFYNDVDVQICTSLREGTPNPMFEAASCGKPLISTNVGAISEFIKDNHGGYLIKEYQYQQDLERVINEFEEKILLLYNNRDIGLGMGMINRLKIEKDWTWKERVKPFDELFNMFK
jgi:glycosyltransferase involved in cell wall biosynthesis